MDDIKQTVKQYILQEFLPGEDPANLTDSLQLIRSGILDSLARLRLVAFLEEHFKIQIEAHEASPANLETLDDITAFVQRKMQK
jgi:acyl carrier protein